MAVSYCFEHYGHDNVEDIISQTLPESFKHHMAELMRIDVPPGRALTDLRAAAWRQYHSGKL